MLIRGPSEAHQRPIRGPSKRQSEAFGASAGRAQSGPIKRNQAAFGEPAGRAQSSQSSAIKRNQAQSGAIRRHSVHLQAEPVVAQHDHRLFAPRALDGTPLILLNLRVDDVAIRDATDEGGNRAYSAAIKRHLAPSSAIQRNQVQSSAIKCHQLQSHAVRLPRTHVEQSHAQSHAITRNHAQSRAITRNQAPSEDARRAEPRALGHRLDGRDAALLVVAAHTAPSIA